MGELTVKNVKSIKTVIITDCLLSLEEFIAIVKYKAKVIFSKEFIANVIKSRNIIERFLKEEKIIYGVTTGFGENVRYTISTRDAAQLQKNIVRSHACAVGSPLDKEQVRAILLMMILNTGKGHSGITIDTLELIRQFLNNDIIPFAPGEGSVGYLGVEAHIALTFMGEGYILKNNEKVPSLEVLKEYNLEPVEFGCKEGLSLLNGTMTVTALAILALYEMIVAMKNIEIAGALVYEALRATTKALDPRIHNAKKHSEQITSAENMLKILNNSEISIKHMNDKVQDAYALRAMPQINGSCKKLIKEAYEVIMNEMHSSSDNPEIFSEDDIDEALMCGNFDGSYVGSHADMLCIAASIIGNLVERCTDRMVNRNLNDGLPAFLVAKPGLNNGFMIPQYTLAGLLGEIKVLTHPSTIDSISTSANQEDPVSMGYFASKKSLIAAKKLQYMVAIEFMVSLQAIDLLKPLKQSPVTEKVHDFIRQKVPMLVEDRYIYPDIEYILKQIQEMTIVDIVEDEIGELKF
ncbi:MAG: histidine ammonia-lyase [Sedimentibacter sp.]